MPFHMLVGDLDRQLSFGLEDGLKNIEMILTWVRNATLWIDRPAAILSHAIVM